MNEAIILYDGQCHFCDKWINFIKLKLKNKGISFITLKSSKSKKLLKDFKIEHEDSIVYIEGDIFYLKSRAVIKICSNLQLPYKLLKNLTILPDFLLDYCYDFIAKRRNIFNPKKECCNG